MNYAIKQLDDTQKTLYQQAQQYLDSQLGHCLDYNYVRISESLKVASAKRLIIKGLNQYTEDFYAVNKQGVLTGVVAINSLLKADDTMLLREILNNNFVKLAGSSELSVAADALILSGKMSLPVCDDKGVFIGRHTVASAYANKQIEANSKLTQSGGLNKDEDLFSSVRQSAKNRSVWLGINLITAFMASAVIGMFAVTLE